MRNATYQMSTFAGAPGERRNLEQYAMRNARGFFYTMTYS